VLYPQRRKFIFQFHSQKTNFCSSRPVPLSPFLRKKAALPGKKKWGVRKGAKLPS